jgi:hypothetical protein
MTQIAKESGVKYESLQKFVHNLALGNEYRRQLEVWLDEKGYFSRTQMPEEIEPIPMPPSGSTDVFHLITARLLNAARTAMAANLERPKKEKVLRQDLDTIVSLLDDKRRN